ncbi:MFS transporter [Paenibacillus sp. YYML68]|uniref:MFS transporter n=1 Tax=Paenibacillus sp. YYML68 TaxID=2909250 RepID=UPI00248FDF0D|nr:MFS transporter [Paenibacillus sp. YYML68]
MTTKKHKLVEHTRDSSVQKPSFPMRTYAVALFLIEFVRGAFLISFLPAYGLQHLGLTTAAIGVAVSVHYVSDTLVKSFAGYMLDRFSLRLIAPIGLGVSLVGLLLVQTASSLWLLAVAAALFGIGISPIWLSGLSRADSRNRGTHMGVLYTCWLAGLGAGPIVVNFILDQSYFFAYWLMLGLWGAALIVSLFMESGHHAQGHQQVQQLSRATHAGASSTLGLGEQLRLLADRLRSMRVLLPAMVLQTMAAGMLVPVLPSFATSSLGLTYSQYSLLLVAAGLFTVGGLIPMGRWIDSKEKRWFVIIGFSVFAVMLYTLTLVRSLWPAVLTAAVLGLAYAAVLPAWNAVLAAYVPEEQKGMGWGLLSSIEGVGIMLGPIAGGWLADQFGPRGAILSSAVLLGFIAVYYLVVSSGLKRGVKVGG